METLKKFVKYYAPYKGVFFLDLLCAAIISFVDLAFPQILRTMTKTLFTETPEKILHALLPVGIVLLIVYLVKWAVNIMSATGTYDGSENGTRHAPAII